MVLLVVDGNSILNRAFYGVRDLKTSDGRPTNGIFGFMNMLLSLTNTYRPDGVAVAFDLKAPTFRHKLYAAYKANRHPAPVELLEQFQPLKDLLTALGYSIVECEGFEADDILGTLSHACGADDKCYLFTGDRDSFQLVRDNVSVLYATTRTSQPALEYTPARIKEEYGVEPLQMIEIKTIQGDASDNFPGVKGIGEKGAGDLIRAYGSVDYIYEHLDELDLKPAVKAKLEESKEMAKLCHKLSTISVDAPIDTDLSHYRVKPADEKAALRMCRSLELNNLVKKLDFSNTDAVEEDIPAAASFKLYEAEPETLLAELKQAGKAYFACRYNHGSPEFAVFRTDKGLALLQNGDFSFLTFFGEFAADASIEKITDDAKHLYDFCDRSGFALQALVLDTTLAAYLLDPQSSSYSVNELRRRYKLGAAAIVPEEDLADFFEREKTTVEAAAFMKTLSEKLGALIDENGQRKLLTELEIPLARVLASMEREGFSIDRAGLEAYSADIKKQLEGKLDNIYELAGERFNVNSPKQLGEILFSPEKLGLKHGKKTKTGYSTNAEELEKLRDEHPVIPAILSYRQLAKLDSTYCEGLLGVIDTDGRIHSTLNQTETRTGRISSSEPNLQNIPVRTPLGRELRRFFNAREGCVLADADYSQIELRVLASLADDQAMIEAFRSGDDIHSITASQVFGIPLAEVKPEDRRRAKAVNFGIVYGIGAYSLGKNIGAGFSEADRYIKSYLAHYSGIAAFMDRCRESAKEKGYAETYYGRRRYLPELNDRNPAMRSFGERVAMNMPIQGTAADIIKIAMIRVYERLAQEFPEARLILQIHDELIIETPERDAEAVANLLRDVMEHACDLAVPLTVDCKCGKTWYDTK